MNIGAFEVFGAHLLDHLGFGDRDSLRPDTSATPAALGITNGFVSASRWCPASVLPNTTWKASPDHPAALKADISSGKFIGLYVIGAPGRAHGTARSRRRRRARSRRLRHHLADGVIFDKAPSLGFGLAIDDGDVPSTSFTTAWPSARHPSWDVRRHQVGSNISFEVFSTEAVTLWQRMRLRPWKWKRHAAHPAMEAADAEDHGRNGRSRPATR